MAHRVWIAALMLIATQDARAADACEARSGARTGVLLELYTSEGCSSCPPADASFARLAAGADPQALNLLAFHVDYWNELGWTDPWSAPAHTRRQQERVRAGGGRTVYTPQLMLSTRLGLRWNQSGAVAAAIAEEQQRPARADLHLQATRTHEGWRLRLDAAAQPQAAGTAKLYLSMYEDGLESRVGAGENAGAHLHHERVVRGLWGPWPLAERVLDIKPPAGARAERLGLVAFVQTPQGETLQALGLPLRGCAQQP